MNERRLRDQKYYLIAVRVPDSVEYSLAIGLDIEKWLKKGLVDLFSVASYLQFNDWTYSADLAKKYDVPVYPSLDESRVQDAYSRYKRNCLKAYYGRIMHVWDSGCNGVFMFNNSGLKDPYHNVVPNNWFLDDAGDFRKALEVTARGKDFVNTLSKRYFTSFRGSGRVAGGSLPHARYINIPVLNRKEPIETYKGPANSIPIRISDDLDENRKNRIVPKATFFMTISEQPNDLQIRCNGGSCPHNGLPHFHHYLCQRSCYHLLLTGNRKKNSAVLRFQLFLCRCNRKSYGFQGVGELRFKR
jgi:hypothetical protein